MADVTIIIEGKADKKFLQDYINHVYSVELEHDDFIVVDGNESKLNLVQTSIRTSTEQGKNNLLIFDADQSDYESTLEAVEKKREELELEFDTFLFPNNVDTGNLETLLQSIINPTNGGLLDCIDNYANCATELELEDLRPFNEKAKIYVYIDSFVIGGQARVDSRDYSEARLWNLNSDSLLALKGFLDHYFVDEA